MDFEITIKTQGNYLSTRTLFGIISDFVRVFELGTIDALIQEFPSVSHTLLQKRVKGKIDFNLEDVRRGSWEIVLVGAIGGIIGKAIYDLAMDALKTSPQWTEFKNRLQRPSQDAAKNIAKRIEKQNKFGPLGIEKKTLTVEKTPDGISRIKYEVTLVKTLSKVLTTTDDQVDDLLNRIQSDDKKDH